MKLAYSTELLPLSFLQQGVLALGLAIRVDRISRRLPGTETSPEVRGSDSDALHGGMFRLIMMLVTEMNHLLNMLTLALQEETEPGLLRCE